MGLQFSTVVLLFALVEEDTEYCADAATGERVVATDAAAGDMGMDACFEAGATAGGGAGHGYEWVVEPGTWCGLTQADALEGQTYLITATIACMGLRFASVMWPVWRRLPRLLKQMCCGGNDDDEDDQAAAAAAGKGHAVGGGAKARGKQRKLPVCTRFWRMFNTFRTVRLLGRAYEEVDDERRIQKQERAVTNLAKDITERQMRIQRPDLTAETAAAVSKEAIKWAREETLHLGHRMARGRKKKGKKRRKRKKLRKHKHKRTTGAATETSASAEATGPQGDPGPPAAGARKERSGAEKIAYAEIAEKQLALSMTKVSLNSDRNDRVERHKDVATDQEPELHQATKRERRAEKQEQKQKQKAAGSAPETKAQREARRAKEAEEDANAAREIAVRRSRAARRVERRKRHRHEEKVDNTVIETVAKEVAKAKDEGEAADVVASLEAHKEEVTTKMQARKSKRALRIVEEVELSDDEDDEEERAKA